MPRSSRHRSHRSHKHSRDRSDSDEEGSARERRNREGDPDASSRARVSRDPETGKRRSSHERVGKDLVGTSNGDASGEHVKKRKERVEEVADDERWNGGREADLKRTKSEDFSPVEFDKSSKSKLLAVDFKERSDRRHEDLNERDEDSGGKNEFTKPKSGKGSGRRESSSQYDDGKVSDKLERDGNKDREGQESRHDKSEELLNRKYGSKSSSSTEVPTSRKYTKITENKVQDVFNSPEAEKGFEKRDRKRDGSEEKDKWLDEGRDTDDRKQSSREDISKSRIYKDEKHEDTKHRGKYRNDTDKVQKYNDDKYQEERLSKDRSNDKSEKWHLRDDTKPVESHYRKTKLHDSDHDGAYADDYDIKFKDRRGRKRYADELEDHNDPKPRSARERHEVVDKNASSTSRTGSRSDKPRSEYHHSEKTDSSPRSNRLKSSISSNAYAVKDRNRDASKLTESVHREPAAEERLSSIPGSKGDSSTSAINDRTSGNRSGKLTTKGDSGDVFMETTAASKYDRTLRSDARTSPNHSRRRSPSTNSGQRISERSPKYDRTSRQRLDIEIGQRNSHSKDGDRRESWGQPIANDVSQNDVSARELTPVRQTSINRSGNLSDYSRNHLLPPTPMRLGSPSVLGPYQDDNRAQSSEHKSYNHHKRAGDLGFGRGHGNSWKNGPPTWPSPVPNGFAPMQHGPPAGFHPAMSPFSAPPFFGVRPPMIHGVSYHMHDEADRFSSHGRPFGWHNPVDHSHLQMWDGSNGIYSNEPYIYGRPEWDEGNQLGSRAWEMGSETWKGQNSNSMCIPVSKEQESSTNSLTDELAQSKSLLTESSEAKKSNAAVPAKISAESSAKIATKTAESSSVPGDEISKHVASYFSQIEISPDLVDPELLQRCTSLSEAFDAKCSFVTHRCFQTNKDGSLVKIKSSSSIMKSFFPTAKDDLFKRAMSLYRKHNEGLSGKYSAASLRVCSEKSKSLSSEDADNMEVEGDADQAPLEENPHCDDDPIGDTKAGNDAGPMDCDSPANANDAKKFVVMSDSVISTTSSQPCEPLIEECSEPVTRIPAH